MFRKIVRSSRVPCVRTCKFVFPLRDSDGADRRCSDPLNTRTDAEVLSALRRTWLLPPSDTPIIDAAIQSKFSLDSSVSDEGSNYSAGEKQLLALCRALIKNSRIIVLDEATSSVDANTDAKVQKTIQREFSSSTLLCIAHRLKTIGEIQAFNLCPLTNC